jgi:hypothetical protein
MAVACGSHQNIGIDDEFGRNFHIAGDVSIHLERTAVNRCMREWRRNPSYTYGAASAIVCNRRNGAPRSPIFIDAALAAEPV